MDGCIKEAIKLVPDILAADADADGAGRAAALGREESLVGLLSSLCSFLVVVPGHPDHGPFYLATGLLNVIQSAPWRSPASQPTLYVRVLSLFATYAQQRLPYRVAGVDSNDVLYAAEPDYAGQVKAMAAQIVASALKGIEAGDGGDMNARRQLAGAALALFDVVVSSITLDAEISALAARLYAIAAKGVEKPVLRAAVRRVAGLAQGEGVQGLGRRAEIDLCSGTSQLVAHPVGGATPNVLGNQQAKTTPSRCAILCRRRRDDEHVGRAQRAGRRGVESTATPRAAGASRQPSRQARRGSPDPAPHGGRRRRRSGRRRAGEAVADDEKIVVRITRGDEMTALDGENRELRARVEEAKLRAAADDDAAALPTADLPRKACSSCSRRKGRASTARRLAGIETSISDEDQLVAKLARADRRRRRSRRRPRAAAAYANDYDGAAPPATTS